MSLAMLGMGRILGVAGVLQARMEPVICLGFMTAQARKLFWCAVRWGLGLILLT